MRGWRLARWLAAPLTAIAMMAPAVAPADGGEALPAVLIGSVVSDTDVDARPEADQVLTDHPDFASEVELPVTLPVPDVADAAERHFGNRFTAARVEGRGPDAVIVVAATGTTSEDAQQLRAETGLGARQLRVLQAEHSEHALQELMDRAQAALADRSLMGVVPGKPWAMGPRHHFSSTGVRSEIVVASAQFSEEELAGLRESIPDELRVIEEDPLFEVELVHSDRFSGLPYEAGLHVEVAGVTDCSTNYVHGNAFGVFGSTAGHCAPTGHPWLVRMGTYHTGTRAQYYWNQPGNEAWSDTAFFPLPSQPQARIMRGPNSHRLVTGRTTGATPYTRVCHQGHATGGWGGCSDLNHAGLRFTDANGVTHRMNDCASHSFQVGDSGGGVYIPRSGDGATAVGSTTANVTWNGGRRGCFSRIRYAVDRFGPVLTINGWR